MSNKSALLTSKASISATVTTGNLNVGCLAFREHLPAASRALSVKPHEWIIAEKQCHPRREQVDRVTATCG